MFSAAALVLSAVSVSVRGGRVPFPAGFQFGASSAAYQVEGGWNQSDAGESNWERFTHARPGQPNGDVAANSYHQWRRDVQAASELGLQIYKFSISWSRLLPTGYSNVVSEDGAKYYSELIDALLEAGVQPAVTLCRFDIPQVFQDYGGWLNPLIVGWFSEYARVVFSLYSPRVQLWETLTEPSVLCDLSYSTGALAPGLREPARAPYLCVKHALLAHATAWRIYDKEFKPLYHGKVSITNHMVWLYPASEEYSDLTKKAYELMSGRHTHPVYSAAGGWPPSVVELMDEVSAREGLNSSRLPKLSQEEIQLIRGTYDYFALSYFTCRVVRAAGRGEQAPGEYFLGLPELGAVLGDPPRQLREALPAIAHCPGGLRRQLAWIREQYGDIPVFISESGWSSGAGLQDPDRVLYIRSSLEQVLVSIHVDRVNVTGFSYYSLTDGFQWQVGYSVGLGLYEVDFTSPSRPRSPRASARYYRDVIAARALDFTLDAANQSYLMY